MTKNSLNIYTEFQISLADNGKNDIDFQLNKIFNQTIYVINNYPKYIFISFIFFIALGAFYYYKKKIIRRVHFAQLNKNIQELQLELNSKKIISEQNQQIFNQIINLAQNNRPEFLTLFSSHYPEFIYNLKQKAPHIRNSELTFCAFAYLNFSTKNIADITFVTVRAVQIRKNRLRKKFDIPSHIDFNTWFLELGKSNLE